MPTHIETIEVSQEAMALGAREEYWAQLLAKWRAHEISDELWEQMRHLDPEFRQWLRLIGAG